MTARKGARMTTTTAGVEMNTRETFLKFHYAHPELYLALRKEGYRAARSGKTHIEINELAQLAALQGHWELLDLHETCLKHYKALLAADPLLWKLLRREN